MPFRDRGGGDLASRIDTEVRERLEEALDAACLEILVATRQAQQLPPPAADSEHDRAAYEVEVRQLLERLDAHFLPLVSEELRGKTRDAGLSGRDPQARLMAVQVMLAKELPDYWQQFDAVRQDYAGGRSASRGESRGFLRRLFGLG
jgi:hypothetical protein